MRSLGLTISRFSTAPWFILRSLTGEKGATLPPPAMLCENVPSSLMRHSPLRCLLPELLLSYSLATRGKLSMYTSSTGTLTCSNFLSMKFGSALLGRRLPLVCSSFQPDPICSIPMLGYSRGGTKSRLEQATTMTSSSLSSILGSSFGFSGILLLSMPVNGMTWAAINNLPPTSPSSSMPRENQAGTGATMPVSICSSPSFKFTQPM
mmetsp:Transcript_20116/g.41903  ORF Transcript_20116/g.41903 Transcript_20116/m.41903 type:complete len:207 (+) Transcript_20116:3283-3903(+)